MSNDKKISLTRRHLIEGSNAGAAIPENSRAAAQAVELAPALQLLTIEAIKQLKARYFMCLDLKDWSGLREVFTDDATFDVRGARKVSQPGSPQADPLILGADAFVDYARERLTPIVSAHYGHMPVIDIISEQEASGVWAMEDWLYGTTGMLHGQGHYHETYKKIDGRWLIHTLRITRLHVTSTL
jgi:hypothetical protein